MKTAAGAGGQMMWVEVNLLVKNTNKGGVCGERRSMTWMDIDLLHQPGQRRSG